MTTTTATTGTYQQRRSWLRWTATAGIGMVEALELKYALAGGGGRGLQSNRPTSMDGSTTRGSWRAEHGSAGTRWNDHMSARISCVFVKTTYMFEGPGRARLEGRGRRFRATTTSLLQNELNKLWLSTVDQSINQSVDQ